VDDLSKVALAVLTLAAAGTPVPEVLADALARGVLAEPKIALARQVAEGGPHKLLRAIELAELLLAVGSVEVSEGKKEARQAGG
jgi:hypothetical protein